MTLAFVPYKSLLIVITSQRRIRLVSSVSFLMSIGMGCRFTCVSNGFWVLCVLTLYIKLINV